MNIRWRLTFWNTLALAVLLLGFSALVYGMLQHALYQRIDRVLLTQKAMLEQDSRLANDPDRRLRHWIEEFEEHVGIFCVIYDADGSVYLRSEQLPPDSVPALPAESQLHDLTLPTFGRQRALVSPLSVKDTEFTVLLMAPLQEVDQALHQLLVVLLTTGPIALVLSGGIGYLLARKALAPMEQLHRSTEEITAEHLDRRLPVVNPKDELGRLSQTINAMIGRLERSFAEIRRFTADASHELRTPLTAIRTEAEVALGKPLSAAEYQQLLGSILEECERLTRLTDQLLTLSREDACVTRSARELVDLAALVEEVAETMRPLAETKGLHLSVNTNGAAWVQGEGTRLRQVFYNLLDNAIKYTPEGGEVAILLQQQEYAAVVTVSDTGIGIPPEHLPRVFDRFYRVDKARSRAQGGTGLGLSIVQSIVHAHGGRVELTSTPGQGTTCTVILPKEPKA